MTITIDKYDDGDDRFMTICDARIEFRITICENDLLEIQRIVKGRSGLYAVAGNFDGRKVYWAKDGSNHVWILFDDLESWTGAIVVSEEEENELMNMKWV